MVRGGGVRLAVRTGRKKGLWRRKRGYLFYCTFQILIPFRGGRSQRIAPDMETAKELAHAIAYEGLSEDAFKAKTVSLYPVVAKILGWEICA